MATQSDQTDKRYDLFISHAEEDRAWVNGYLLDALKQASLSCLTEATFALGVPRILEFQRAIQQSKRILLVLSPAYITDETLKFVDILAEGYGLETATWPVIPLILHPVTLPIRLSTLTALDMTDPDQQREGLSRLLNDLQRAPLAEALAKPACPYPGMEPFSEAYSRRFFGRDQEIQESLNRLRLRPFLAYIGPSGSGKSSLAMAGLVPAIQKSSLFGDGNWLVRTLRPGDAPLNALADKLGGNPTDPAPVVSDLLAKEGCARLLLIVDQFEEVFTLAQPSGSSFQEALLKLAETPNCFTVLTVRADFYPDLMAMVSLWREVQAHRLEVLPLNENGLRQAIMRPAEDVGVYVEAALVERLIADAAGEPGVLPLLQETLRLLWDRLERRYLPLRAYETLVLSRRVYGPTGQDKRTGLQVAMVNRADNTLAALPPDQQVLARRAFLRLVQFGEGREDTRRQQSMEALQAGSDPVAFARMLEHLVANRLLILSGDEADTRRRVDIAHEALIKCWPTLQEWLQQNREAEQVHRRLENKAAEWVSLGRGTGGLLDEVELAETTRWLASPDSSILGYSADLKEYVETSRSVLQKANEERERIRQYQLILERRAKNRARFIAGSLAVFSAILTILAGYAYGQRAEAISNAGMAQTNAAIANDNARDALSRELAALSSLNIKGQPDLAALLSLYSASSKDTFEARSSLLNVLQLNGHFIATLDNGPMAIYSVAYNPRTDQLAAGTDGAIVLWDIHDRQRLGPPLLDARNMGVVRSVAFSPDGAVLASGSEDGIIRVWDLVNRKATTLTLPANTKMGSVYSLAFGCDGTMLASGTDDGFIRLWDVKTYQSVEPPVNAEKIGSIRSLAFMHKKCQLASGDANGKVMLWDVNERKSTELGTTIQQHSNWVLSLAFSPDDEVLASGGADAKIRLWDMEKRELIGAPLEGGNWVRSLAFASGEGIPPLLASGGDDGNVWLWDWQAIRQRKTVSPITYPLTGHSGGIYGLAFAHNAQMLISGAVDHKVILWRIDGNLHTFGQVLNTISSVSAVCFIAANKTIAIAQTDGTILLWDVQGQRGRAVNASMSKVPILALACSPDGKSIVSGDAKGTITIWDVTTGRSTALQQVHSSPVRALAFSKDGMKLASGGDDGKLFLWDPSNSQLPDNRLTNVQDASSINSLVFDPDGTTLASGDSGGKVTLWTIQIPTARVIYTIPSGNATSVSFSPDGKILAFGGNDGQIRMWNVQNETLIPGSLQGHDGRYPIYSLAFSPDNLILASGSGDKKIILWDLRSRLALGMALVGHIGSVRSLSFSSTSGLSLVSASDSSPGAIVWDLDPEHWRQLACSIANRSLTPDEQRRFLGQTKLNREPCQ